MATLCSLKQALREIAQEVPASSSQRLSDIQYSDGFDILVRGSGNAYRDFIVPQLSQLFSTFNSPISLLEIGPGPKSVLGYLPRQLRRLIEKYTAFEPNNIFATKLEDWLRHTSGDELPLPGLEDGYTVHRTAFSPLSDKDTSGRNDDGIFDVILFCHSLYGMKHKRGIIEQSLRMLVDRPRDGMLVVFHRDYTLRLDGLLTDRRTSFPTGIITIPDKDEILDAFASFVAGFAVEDSEIKKSLQVKWRAVCRTLGRGDQPGCLSFNSPEAMMVFKKRATALSRLALQVPLLDGIRTVKNREARLHHPAAVVVPTEVEHIQRCVQWAIEQGIGLTVIGGGHSGHCLWPGVVSIDMSAFNQVRVHAEKHKSGLNRNTHPCVVAGAGCKTEDIIRGTMAEGLTVPLGSRPSVGAGLWLQGGLGHLARLYGLACDAILGAIMVSVKTGEIIVVGYVPSEHVPLGAVHPNNEADVLWALKGAGTNIGIVISVAFKAFPAPFYSVRNWIIPVDDAVEAHNRLGQLSSLTSKLPRHCSADVYLYRDNSKLRLGVTVFEILDAESPLIMPVRLDKDLGPANSIQLVDGVGLFDCEMYMSGMHGGHGSGKTSSFKRCLFLKNIGQEEIVQLLVAAFETCPTPLCYVHLLHGGGAVRDIKTDDTAFGTRDWDYACIVTGVWPRESDHADVSGTAVRWVYTVARSLLPFSTGVYGADLGPDPRDASLATMAFGLNGPRLADLKRRCDPHSVLAYACPVPRIPSVVILVTGQSCSGKDYCANIWASVLNANANKAFTARIASISDATKRAYALATGCDLDLLLHDRAYKEEHRSRLTAFYQRQVDCRDELPKKHFLSVVSGTADADVLFITGMRDEAPIAVFSPLVPNTRLIEITIRVTEELRQARRGSSRNGVLTSDEAPLDYHPSFVFHNDENGSEAAENFAERWLNPFFDKELRRLADMVRLVPDFPCAGVDFRHVLNIAQRHGGLKLCTSLLRTHFTGDWSKVDYIACCQTGGFVFGPALSMQIGVPMALIREGGKLPPPVTSVPRRTSHISSVMSTEVLGKCFEMEKGLLSREMSVVVVDDVLASGHTLCAMLQLLNQAGISTEKIHVMVVAEFPAHSGRRSLRDRGFGSVKVQSLLVFSGH